MTGLVYGGAKGAMFLSFFGPPGMIIGGLGGAVIGGFCGTIVGPVAGHLTARVVETVSSPIW